MDMFNRIGSVIIAVIIIQSQVLFGITKNVDYDSSVGGSSHYDLRGGKFSGDGVSILLVSDQTDGVDNPEYYDSIYIDVLEANNYSYSVWDHEVLGSPTFEDIEDYEMIIWFTGISGEYSADNETYGHLTLTLQEEATLLKYLSLTEGDRMLVLSGMWIAWNCVADASSQQQIYSPLFSGILGLEYHQDNFMNWIEVDDDWTVDGVAGSPFFSGGTYDIDWNSSGNFPDQLESVEGKETAKWMDETNTSHHNGIVYNSMEKSNGTARMVLMSCPLEAIGEADDRKQIIEEMCNWAGIYPVSIQSVSLGNIKSLFSD